MNKIISLQLLHTFRTITDVSGRKNRTLTPLLLFFIIAVLHIYIKTKADTNNLVISGWIILGIFIVYCMFGLVSNRIPSKMEDVLWTYSVPIPFYKVIISYFIHRAIIRSIFWIGAAIVADIILFFIYYSFYNITSTSILSFLIIITLELSSLATSSMRGNMLYTLCTSITFTTILILYAGATYFFVLQGHLNYVSTVQYLGLLLYGDFNLIGLCLVLFVIILSLFVIYTSSLSLKNKEKLVVEADFWSQFKDFGSLVSSVRGKDRPSWWGGKCLTGIGAFIWFEYLIIRKHIKSILFQFLLGALLLYFALNWSINLFQIILVLISITSLVGSYFSSLIRHTLSEDLFLIPGHLIKKIFTLELLAISPSIFSISLLYLIWSFSSNMIQIETVLIMINIFLLIIGIRCVTFCKIFLKTQNSSIFHYYLTLTRYLFISLLSILVLREGLKLLSNSYTLPISILLISFYLIIKTYNDVQEYLRRMSNIV
jgi:sporulation killing factor system integral membrane protein